MQQRKFGQDIADPQLKFMQEVKQRNRDSEISIWVGGVPRKGLDLRVGLQRRRLPNCPRQWENHRPPTGMRPRRQWKVGSQEAPAEAEPHRRLGRRQTAVKRQG